MGTGIYITEITKEKKGKLLVHTDSAGSFPVYQKEAAQYHLEEHTALSEEAWERLRREVLEKRVIKRAMYLLQKQDYTEAQLRRKLEASHYPSALVDVALEYVKSFRYIDDFRYAGTYIRYHQSQKSRQQLKTALLSRGISADLIEQALEEEYEGDEDALIRSLLLKKHYDADGMDRKEKYRIYQYLARRGFDSSAIRRNMEW